MAFVIPPRSLAWVAAVVTMPMALVAQAKVGRPHPRAADLARSVVMIEVDRLDGPATGSGVIVDPTGVIATAAHVIAGASSARVRLSSGDVLKVEGVIEADADLDLALVRVAGFQLPAATLGNSDSLELGQRLIAISAPIGLQTTVTDGLLSAVRHDGNRKLLQISVPVSHGSSGGPVFTEEGAVVGLVVTGFRADVAENVNFALPINYARGKLALATSKAPTPLAQVIAMPATPSLNVTATTATGTTTPDSQQLAAAVTLLTTGSNLAKARDYPAAYTLLDSLLTLIAPRNEADTLGSMQQVRINASFWYGLTSVLTLNGPYKEMTEANRASRCPDARAVFDRLARTKAALLLGRRVHPPTADQMLGFVAQYERAKPSVQAAFKCTPPLN